MQKHTHTDCPWVSGTLPRCLCHALADVPDHFREKERERSQGLVRNGRSCNLTLHSSGWRLCPPCVPPAGGQGRLKGPLCARRAAVWAHVTHDKPLIQLVHARQASHFLRMSPSTSWAFCFIHLNPFAFSFAICQMQYFCEISSEWKELLRNVFYWTERGRGGMCCSSNHNFLAVISWLSWMAQTAEESNPKS